MRLARGPSRVSPWLAMSNSGQSATYPSPSRSMMAIRRRDCCIRSLSPISMPAPSHSSWHVTSLSGLMASASFGRGSVWRPEYKDCVRFSNLSDTSKLSRDWKERLKFDLPDHVRLLRLPLAR